MINIKEAADRALFESYALATLPENINTIVNVSTKNGVVLVLVSERRKPTKKEKRICEKLIYLTPVINGMQYDEWVGYTCCPTFNTPIELRWKRLRAGELEASIKRLLADLHMLDDLDSDIEWTGDDDDDAFGMLGSMCSSSFYSMDDDDAFGMLGVM